MLSPSDTILIFVVALLLFGPEQLPKIARQLGDAMRHVQSTTSAFMAEMDRAAAAADRTAHADWNAPVAPTAVGTAPHPEETPAIESESSGTEPNSPNPNP